MSTVGKLKLLRADLIGAASFSPAEVTIITSDVNRLAAGFRDIQQTVRAIGPELNLQYDRRMMGTEYLYLPTFVVIREFGVSIPATPGDIESWLISAYKSSKSEKILMNLSEIEELILNEPKDVKSKMTNFIRLLKKSVRQLGD